MCENDISDNFDRKIGVRLGEELSPILFALVLNANTLLADNMHHDDVIKWKHFLRN